MRRPIFYLLIALTPSLAQQNNPTPGARIQGIVVEDETGHPLAWTQITLTPLPGVRVRSLTSEANERGSFALNPPPGIYTLRATRQGFADTEAGQMRAGRPGTPFEITAAGKSAFFQLRMQRLAAITGTVLDTNNVGIPDWPVHLYSARKPIRHIAGSVTDDRGVFRIGALQSGSYLIAAAGGTLDDNTPLLPAYFQDAASLDAAEPLRVRIAQTRQDVTFRMLKGRLYRISGVFVSAMSARLTLITSSGRRVIASTTSQTRPVAVTAADVPPGPVEIEAEGAQCYSYIRAVMAFDLTGARFTCEPPVRVELNIPAANARRVSLDATGAPRTLRSGDSIPPGNWEIMPEIDAGHYVVSVSGAARPRDGWFPIASTAPSKIEIALSEHPATISGVATSAGKPAPGAGVYLQLFNPDFPRDVLRQWSTRADTEGAFQFPGLAPGDYRILSSFDFDPEDIGPMLAAPVLSLREGDRIAHPLEIVFP